MVVSDCNKDVVDGTGLVSVDLVGIGVRSGGVGGVALVGSGLVGSCRGERRFGLDREWPPNV